MLPMLFSLLMQFVSLEATVASNCNLLSESSDILQNCRQHAIGFNTDCNACLGHQNVQSMPDGQIEAAIKLEIDYSKNLSLLIKFGGLKPVVVSFRSFSAFM